MLKPVSWTKKTRYHVIDNTGADKGNYATKKTALSRAKDLDNINIITAPWLTDREVISVKKSQPHRIEPKTTNKGNYNKQDIIQDLHNKGY